MSKYEEDISSWPISPCYFMIKDEVFLSIQWRSGHCKKGLPLWVLLERGNGSSLKQYICIMTELLCRHKMKFKLYAYCKTVHIHIYIYTQRFIFLKFQVISIFLKIIHIYTHFHIINLNWVVTQFIGKALA